MINGHYFKYKETNIRTDIFPEIGTGNLRARVRIGGAYTGDEIGGVPSAPPQADPPEKSVNPAPDTPGPVKGVPAVFAADPRIPR